MFGGIGRGLGSMFGRSTPGMGGAMDPFMTPRGGRGMFGAMNDIARRGLRTTQPQDNRNYAQNFSADNLMGFSAEDIRGSARGKDFEISDQQVDDYFAGLSPEAQAAWDNYKPKAGAFASLREKHGLGGSNPLWDYENNTLDRRAVAQQGLRNRLAEHERGNSKLASGLNNLFMPGSIFA